MKNIKIREYQEQDKSTLTKLMVELQNHFFEIDVSGKVKKFDNVSDAGKYIEKAISDVNEMNGKVYIAENNQDIVGFIQGVIINHGGETMHTVTHICEPEGWIGLLYVIPEYRKQGISTQLCNTIKTHFKKNSCKSINLKVDAQNEIAIMAYKKLGFFNKEIVMSQSLLQ